MQRYLDDLSDDLNAHYERYQADQFRRLRSDTLSPRELRRLKRAEVNAGNYKFYAGRLVVPAACVVAGAWRFTDSWMLQANHSVRDGMAEIRSHHIHVDDYLQYLPSVGFMGLEYVGIDSRQTLLERTFILANSYLVMGVLVNSMKYTVGELRPDNSTHNSFPSGHTATAFMGAELCRIQYGATVGVTAYTVAAATAFLRMYNNRHWLTDVMAGAGIGILSARVGYWMLPLERRWFHLQEKQMVAAPYYDPQSQALGATLSLQW